MKRYMEEEIWKDVGIIKGVDYTGLYQCSNYGQVRSLDRYEKFGKYERFRKGAILKPKSNGNTYFEIPLSKNNIKNYPLIHRLVAITFELPIPEEFKHIPIEELDVEHIDCDPSNNRLDNLRWNDRSGNMQNPITKQRISDANKGKKRTEDFKNHLSERMKGENNPFYGKHHTEESKKKMSTAKKAK